MVYVNEMPKTIGREDYKQKGWSIKEVSFLRII